MDPSIVQTTPSIEEDEWDTEGFEIPSLGIEIERPDRNEIERPDRNEIERPDRNEIDFPEVEDSKLSEVQRARKEEDIYLGPHGAPPSQVKQQEQKTVSRKQKFKQKLKEADRVYSGTGRENKVDNLRELVGGGKMPMLATQNSARDWLDPHCHESQFEKRYLH